MVRTFLPYATILARTAARMSEWTCAACDIVNDADVDVCGLCGEAAPSHAPRLHATSERAPEAILQSDASDVLHSKLGMSQPCVIVMDEEESEQHDIAAACAGDSSSTSSPLPIAGRKRGRLLRVKVSRAPEHNDAASSDDDEFVDDAPSSGSYRGNKNRNGEENEEEEEENEDSSSSSDGSSTDEPSNASIDGEGTRAVARSRARPAPAPARQLKPPSSGWPDAQLPNFLPTDVLLALPTAPLKFDPFAQWDGACQLGAGIPGSDESLTRQISARRRKIAKRCSARVSEAGRDGGASAVASTAPKKRRRRRRARGGAPGGAATWPYEPVVAVALPARWSVGGSAVEGGSNGGSATARPVDYTAGHTRPLPSFFSVPAGRKKPPPTLKPASAPRAAVPAATLAIAPMPAPGPGLLPWLSRSTMPQLPLAPQPTARRGFLYPPAPFAAVSSASSSSAAAAARVTFRGAKSPHEDIEDVEDDWLWGAT